MAEPKDFNNATIWGRIHKAEPRTTKSNSRPYIDLTIICNHDEYGDVFALARLWGPDAVKAFQQDYAAHPDEVYKFKGEFTQYIDTGQRRARSNFRVYDYWRGIKEEIEHRAVFVLRGEVTGKDFETERSTDVILKILIKKKDKQEENYIAVWVYEDNAKEFGIGDRVKIKGSLIDSDAEWGGGGTFIPFAHEIEYETAPGDK